MGCDVCKSLGWKGGAVLCARCRLKLRHAARVLRGMLHALCNDHVLHLLNELADRVQPAAAPVFVQMRGAAAEVHGVQWNAERNAQLMDADGWLLEMERAA